ncbi:MAG: 4Fe-4S dicluster domain-containing protein [Vicinamibacterales bacterium]
MAEKIVDAPAAPASPDNTNSRRPAVAATVWPSLRLASQTFFFGVFLFLLVRTEFRGSLRSAETAVRLPWPVSIFLESDPLVAVANALSTGALYRGLLWSLVILVPTLFLGRFFCGWICPFGTLNHFFGAMKSEKKRGQKLLESNRYKKWQASKYYILAVTLVLAVFGTLVVGLLDPISLLVRSLSVAVLPAFNYAANATFEAMYASGLRPFELAADGGRLILQSTILSFRQPYFSQAAFVGLILVFILVLNARVTRFWCRAICPLGALLGLASRWSIVNLHKDDEACDSCRRCLLRCQGGDDPLPGAPWRKPECHLCFNCVSECPQNALGFKIGATAAQAKDAPELQRRKVMAGLAAAAGMLPLLRSTRALTAEPDPRLIRPPGSLAEDEFLARCIRCGECMKVCPNNALHPTLTEAGIEGLWSPVLVPRIGYCEPSCVLCGQVCPTGAIWELTQVEKVGRPAGGPSGEPAVEANKIGTAFYDHGRCLPWSMATECIVCEEWCPTSPKAIYLRPAEVVDAKGNAKIVRQPHVNPENCTGCGACEYACPIHDRPAVYVTSIGESRSRTNQILLDRGGPPR